MSTHKHINKICCAVLALALIITLLFMNADKLGINSVDKMLGYETRLFDTSKVHTINIVMDDWEDFLSTCTNEEYTDCSVIIDNQAYNNVAIRAKGNTSLQQVTNDRYSFKIEFDHYDSTTTYYGLDKLSLNNIIQDTTYMKDYLSYQLMQEAGADAPLCSYVQVLVNGEEWGLYLAVECVEESFLQRNYGNDYGELYKPDSISMSGGVGNGGKFDMDKWREENGQPDAENGDANQNSGTPSTDSSTDNIQSLMQQDSQQVPDGTSPELPDGEMPDMENMPQMPNGNQGGGGMGGSRGSDDVSLIYTDDKYDSYSNIFDNAKTDITDSDKDRLIASIKQLNENTNIEDVVDVEAVIRYFVAHNFTVNYDSYTGSMIHNYYLYEDDGKLSMLPWDYNLAFSGFQGGTDATSAVNYPIDTPVSGGTVDSRPMLAWIFESEEYTELYHLYFAEFIESYFTSGEFEAEIDAVKAMISPYVERDPTKFCTYEEFETGIATLKEFCLLRAASISGQIDGTIPSTSDGQSADSSALIDGSEISISAMGSMNNGGNIGGMKPNNSNGNTESNGGTPPEASDGQMPDMDNMPQMPNGGGMGGNQGDMPQMPNGEQGGQFPGDFDENESNGDFSQMPNGNQNSGTMPEMPNSTQNGGTTSELPDGTQNRENNNGGFSQFPEQHGGGENQPNMQSGQRPDDMQGSSGGVIVITVISVIILIGGLAFALLYKRKGY